MDAPGPKPEPSVPIAKVSRFKRLRMPLVFRLHVFGSLLLLLFTVWVMTQQVHGRSSFASSELYDDVMDRWGAPIEQAMPSVRYVESASVFNELKKKPLDGQSVHLAAKMNYRKRGLVYFSGFDFDFHGRYLVNNEEAKDLDIVFVFPLGMKKNKVLLSDLDFKVNDVEEPINMSEGQGNLSWTGRLKAGEGVTFDISFSGRGLEHFIYELDPSLPVRNFELEILVEGGENYDYPFGVMPAHTVSESEEAGRISAAWQYARLESGVPVGLTLPSEKGYDAIILTMLRRAWAPFLLFFFGVWGLALSKQRSLASWECYFLSACFSFFFVLLPYLAAFMHFYLAYVLSALLIGCLLTLYLVGLLGKQSLKPIAILFVAFMLIPTLAVIARGYTGLIYTLEILIGLFVVSRLIQHSLFDGIKAELKIVAAK